MLSSLSLVLLVMACLNLNKFDKIVVVDKGVTFWNLNFTVLQLTQHNYKLKENYFFGLYLLFRCNIAPTLDFYISNTEHLDGANLLQS